MKPLSLIAAGALLLPIAAHAAPLTAKQLITGFDAVVLGDATTTSEIVGPVLVGGNLGGGSNILDTANIPVTLPGYAQVDIYGNHTGVSVEGAHQSVDIGGSDLGSFLATTSTTGYAFPETIAQITATLDAYSAALATMPATGSYNPATGVFSGPADAVFDVAASAITKPITGLTAGDIVNVTGTSWTDANNYLTGDAIWNFPSATSVTIEQAFAGYILAPYADALVNTAPIEGIAAESYVGEGEIHWGPPLDPPVPTTSVREPSTLAALAVPMIVFGLIGRRRRRVTA